jgi:hypothetical protein
MVAMSIIYHLDLAAAVPSRVRPGNTGLAGIVERVGN